MKKTFLYFIAAFLCINAPIYAQENTKKQKVQIISENFLAENKIPGMAISISINNKLFFSEGFGYSNLKTKEKVKPNLTKFRIASISKTLTAVALAKLVDDKKIDFDASLYTYLPNYPKKNMILP
ncbi:serine hydrolase domain-containing protein [Polaribacter ponticola]|uniref:Serine hydrolase n=1 Tax=Polaribacter ponticola TaxID=2978475 RepID=A0ABT5S4H0_9FLAO|nr:serine hydrolase domain-containing protein [Polaribacter sp. MSW5]MDD7913010.1 serine hydrolase [Polaribacter sp. MSW5]